MVLNKENQLKKPRVKKTYIAHELPKEGFIRRPVVLKALGICSTSLNNGIKQGKYPPGFLLSPRTRVWDVNVIREKMEELKNGGVQ